MNDDVRIVNFYRARAAADEDGLSVGLSGRDLATYRALGRLVLDETSGHFDSSFDIFSVGLTLFEMATGTLPDLSLDRDALLATIDDPAKRALVAFALHGDPSDRPTAEALLRRVTALAPSVTSQQERTFRSLVGDRAPWGLKAGALGSWLEENWVVSNALPECDQTRRRALAEKLSDTDGFELLTKCMTEDTTAPPWVELSQTKTGEPIEDKTTADQLTALLHNEAGLVFYDQLFCVSAAVSPLHDYDFEQRLGSSKTAFAAIVRNRSTKDRRVIKFVRQGGDRSALHELQLSMKASAASQFVQDGFSFGTAARDVIFTVVEFTAHQLGERITARGVESEHDFWEIASQLTRGIADLHRSSILHLSLEVCLHACGISARADRALVPPSPKIFASPRTAKYASLDSIAPARSKMRERTTHSSIPTTSSSTARPRMPTARIAARRTSSRWA